MPRSVLLIAGLAIMMIAAGLVLLLRGGNKDDKRLKRRLRALSSPRAVAKAPTSLSKTEPSLGFGRVMIRRIWAIVGYDPEVPNRPIPNWAAIVLALALGRGITWLMVALCGDLGWFSYPVASLFVLRVYFVWSTNRWRLALFKQFPDALSTIVRAVRVGVSIAEGIRQVGAEAPEPTAAIFKDISNSLAIGTTLTDAMASATSRTGVPEYRFFTTALVLQSRTGGGLAATLEGLADVIRKRVMVRARGKALASEARASGAVLALLPVATVCALFVLSPDYLMPLFNVPMGHKLLAGAALCEGVGIFSMKWLIAKALK